MGPGARKPDVLTHRHNAAGAGRSGTCRSAANVEGQTMPIRRQCQSAGNADRPLNQSVALRPAPEQAGQRGGRDSLLVTRPIPGPSIRSGVIASGSPRQPTVQAPSPLWSRPHGSRSRSRPAPLPTRRKFWQSTPGALLLGSRCRANAARAQWAQKLGMQAEA